jgi:hypothetical protein
MNEPEARPTTDARLQIRETAGDPTALPAPAEQGRLNRHDRIVDAQLMLLKEEIIQLNMSVRQIDEITKSLKGWTILASMTSLGFFLRETALHNFLWVTATGPVLLWFIDLSYRRIQRRMIFRLRRIGRFSINDLAELFSSDGKLRIGLLDALAEDSADDLEAKRFSSFRTVANFETVTVLYAGLVIVAVVLQLLVTL